MEEKAKTRIFISYRREGGIQTARWVHDQLKARGYDVFLDMECLGGGSFNTALLKEIENRDVLLVVLTKNSLKRRFMREDWVRKELAHAFQTGLKVIPLMDKNFEFPKNLPADIAHLPMQGGLRLNFEFAEPWLDKLEKYILSEPQKPIAYPPLSIVCPWPKYLAGALAAVALAGVLFLGIGSCTGGEKDPATDPVKDPIAGSTTAPSLSAEEQQLGNSIGNLCNDGVCESMGWYLTGNGVHYENRIGNWLYHYRDSDYAIRVRHTDDQESKTLATIPNMGYLLVTTDWFYYTVEDGNVATLYRAPRLSVDQMGEAAALVSGFSSNNSIMIDGIAAYYWYTGKGLYRLDLTSGDETQVLDRETTWSTDAFGISGAWIYLNTDTLIQRVRPDTGEMETLLDLAEEFGDCEISACNVDSAWVYVALTDQGKSGLTHNDRIYRMHIDGTNRERLYVAEGADCRISYIGLQSGQETFDHVAGFVSQKIVIGYGCATKRNTISAQTGNYLVCDHVHEEGFAQTLGIHGGNSQTNLCNSGIVTYLPEEGVYAYRTNGNELFLNGFTVEDTRYFYNQADRAIIMQWHDGSESQKQVLMEDVLCHYLYVTPDWFYCVLEEDGVNTLYRAENDPENHAVGELETVVSGFLGNRNHLAIREGYVYYWMEDDGLYRARTDGADVTQVWDQAGVSWHTFHVTDDALYFWLPSGGIYRVNLQEKNHTHVYDHREEPGKLVGTVEKDGKFYFIVTYLTDGERTAPDEIWCINADGTDKTLVSTLPDISMEATIINRSAGSILIRVEQERQTDLYRVTPETGELTHIKTHQ